MDKEYTLEEMRQYCAEYIRKHYGDQYDNIPWWDKWQIISYFKHLKQKEIENEQIYHFGQNE